MTVYRPFFSIWANAKQRLSQDPAPQTEAPTHTVHQITVEETTTVTKRKKKKSRNSFQEADEATFDPETGTTKKGAGKKKKNSLKKRKSKLNSLDGNNSHEEMEDDLMSSQKLQNLTDLVGAEAAQRIVDEKADVVVLEDEEGVQNEYMIDATGNLHLKGPLEENGVEVWEDSDGDEYQYVYE